MEYELLNIKWYVPKKNSLSIEEWGTQSVVYNSQSGETHQLNELAVNVLKIIQNQPVTINLITENICHLYEIEDEQDVVHQMSGLTSQLDTLGLIEPFIE